MTHRALRSFLAFFAIGSLLATGANAQRYKTGKYGLFPENKGHIGIAASGAPVGPTIESLKKFRRGNAFTDFSTIHAALTNDKAMGPNQPPPSGWPASLNAAWTNGIKSCQTGGAAKVWQCTEALGKVLLQRYYEEMKFGEVIIVSVAEGTAKRRYSAQAWRFAPRQTTQDVGLGDNNDAAVAARSAVMLAGGQFKQTEPRVVYGPKNNKAAKASVLLADGKPQLTLPVVTTKACAAARHPVAVSPPMAPLSKTLESLVTRSVTPNAGAPAVRCAMTMTENKGRGPNLFGARSFNVVVSCDDGSRFRATDVGRTPSGAHEKLASKLVNGWVRSRCKK